MAEDKDIKEKTDIDAEEEALFSNEETEAEKEEDIEAEEELAEEEEKRLSKEEKHTKMEKNHKSHSEKKAEKHKKDKRERQEEKAKEFTIKIKKKTMKKALLVLGAIVLLALIVFGVSKLIPRNAGGSTRVEFYVMSQCPYGVQVEDSIKPVLDKLGDSVDFSIDFIANDLGNGAFQSLHGQTEVDGNIVQLCAMKYEPKKYMDLIFCMNQDYSSIPDNWESCATENKLDVAKIKACFEGEEGKTLLSASIERSTARQASGSPTIYINNQQYQGARDSTSFQRAICAGLPSANINCVGLPPCSSDSECPAKEGKIAKCVGAGTADAKCEYNDPVEVGLKIVNDKDCPEGACDSSYLEGVLKQIFPGVKISYVDSGSAEGKALIEELELVYVPAYVFDERLEQTESWASNPNLHGAFEKVGDSYKILDSQSGATYYISDEARQAAMAAKGITLGDNKPQIDFFVMSYCPYGNQAEEVIEPVYQLLKDKAIFNPRYVIYSNYGGGGPSYCLDAESKYCSMHGVQELNQDIRELCVNKYMGIGSYFEFVLAMNDQCTSSNADSCWENVAKELKLDTAKIKACEKEEGLAMAAEELRLNNVWGASGSPTVFIDGVEYSGSRTAEGFKTALCAAFENKPSECSTTLDAGAATTAATGGCG